MQTRDSSVLLDVGLNVGNNNDRFPNFDIPEAIDWDWLINQKITVEMIYTKHIQLKKSINIKMNGQQNKGIILKPE